MAILGKALEAVGMVNLLVGLYYGVVEEHGMAMEYAMLLLGSALFLLGRLLERRAGK